MLKSLRNKWVIYGSGFMHVLLHSPDIKNRKLLIVQMDSLGDVCTLIPSVYPLASQYQLSVVCKKGLEDVWKEFLPMVEVHPVQEKVWSVRKLRTQYPELFQMEFEAVVDATSSSFSALFSSHIKAGRRIGMVEGNEYFKGSRLLYDKLFRFSINEHVTRRFPEMFRQITGERYRPVNPPVRSFSSNSNVILIHPGAKWKPRRWPVDRYMEVARQAVSRWGVSCEFLINESEDDLRQYVQEHNHDDRISVRLTRNASDLLDSVRSCAMLVGNDSGPVHLGNLMNKETVVLWGPGNYKRIRPIGDNVVVLKHEIDCRPCRQYRRGDQCERGENFCLQSIDVEEVVSAIGEKFRKKAMADQP